MNKIFLSGRITSEITTFGNDNATGASFMLVTSKPVIKDGKVVKDDNGYTQTYDQWHRIKVFGGLAKSVAAHKAKGDKLNIIGELRYSKNERNGETFHNADIYAEEIEFI